MAKQLGTILTKLTRHGKGQVATVTVSRPSKLNCLNTHLLKLLPATLNDLTRNNADLICIVLTGDGDKAFIGGADITEMSTLTNPAAARAFITRVHLVCKSIRDCAVPVIGRVNGFTLGAGLAIATACDFRVASKNAIFGMLEVRVGVPSVIEAALFPGLIGWGRTRRLLLLSESIMADEALSWGLVEKVVELAMLDQAVAEWVQCLEKCGPGAVKGQKELMRKWEQMGLNAGIEAGIEHFGKAFELDSAGKGEGSSEADGQGRDSEANRMMSEFLKTQRDRKSQAKL
jgi:enoyl-CoA hydratase